ncbi:MAG: hypothetical protein AAF657_30850 [Acidobacteriota bacterium]
MKKNLEQPALQQPQITDEILEGITGGCGGMTQVDPPSMQLDAGPADPVDPEPNLP